MKKIVFFSIVLFLLTINSVAQCWLQIDSGSGATLTYHSVGIQSNGTLWAWGNNSYGQLGDGTTTNRLVPTQIGTDTDWSYVAAGTDATYAIKQNGTLWAWGRNDKGQLSDGTTINRLLPAQVLPGTIWNKVSAGKSFVVAQKTEGTLWSCGEYTSDQLGRPVTVSSNAYTLGQINTDTDWLDFECGHSHVVLQKTNHTVWGFGDGLSGCLVTGSDAGYNVPTQLMIGTNWTHSIAGNINSMFRKNDGTLWGVGQNLQGVLGVGNNDFGVYSLTQAGTATDWASIESSSLHSMALKNNGTLWVTGVNSSGQLGIGSTAYNINVFTQVGTATNWAKVRCGRTHTLALDTNGTLWAWGDNSQGQLGNGTTTNSNVPIQIGTACSLNTPNFEKSKVQLLSNPVENIMQLSFSIDGQKTIEIYNSLGALLTSKTISSDFISFDVSGYASGVYFVKCAMADNVGQTVKVVKK
jgi:alpha-tubulin suppressor-like RCC1 family protein